MLSRQMGARNACSQVARRLATRYIVNMKQYRTISIDLGNVDGLCCDAGKLREILDSDRISNSIEVSLRSRTWTEFWGRVLAARAGLRTTQQTLDKLALDAALVANRGGREWKTLADSTLDVLYMPGHAVTWRDWQRREDYYPEGVLLWLDVDARLRELTRNNVSLDQFAQLFFATRGSVERISTYSFQDVCDTLNKLAPADWKSFLNQHLFTHASSEAIAGLAPAGWQPTYTSVPTETFLQDEADADIINLDDSIGAQLRPNGSVRSVMWNGPAFRAGLAPDIHVVTVNGQPFTSAVLLSAIADSASSPISLTLQDGENHRDVIVSYAGPLRYPHLERIPNTPDGLASLLAPH